MRTQLIFVMSVAVAIASAAGAQPSPAAGAAQRTAPAARGAVLPGHELLSLDQAKARYRGRLSSVVLNFLSVMDRVVNKDKQPAITAADWAPLGAMIDREKFHRVGNFGVKNDWPGYADLLTMWANSSWWKGYIWRMREVPGGRGEPGLVYLESQERSSQQHPVKDDGDYSTLASIAVYEIDAHDKIVGLHVYDQRPLDRPQARP